MRCKGFSLLECVVVVMIVGMLLGFAYPSYQAARLKKQRAEVMAQLMLAQMSLSRCYAQTGSYQHPCPDLPLHSNGAYTLQLLSATRDTYQLAAIAQGADTDCALFMIDEANQKSAKNAAGAVSARCWEG